MQTFEHSYLSLIGRCLSQGNEIKQDRTGVGTLQLTSQLLEAPSVGEHFPSLTVRPVPFRIAFWETMMFLNGIQDTTFLESKGIEIWKPNTTREFLDSRGMYGWPEKSIGKGYGFQWRNFGGNVIGDQKGVDQIKELLTSLEQNPFDRRHLVSAWNPLQLHDMALPPCHIMNQYMMIPNFNSEGDIEGFTLDSNFYMRSCDMIFGLPFNMQSYAFLNILFSKYLEETKTFKEKNMKVIPGKVTFMGGDCHVYKNQVPMAMELIARRDLSEKSPKLHIKKKISSFSDMIDLDYSDVELIDYHPLPQIKDRPKMAV